MNPDKFNLRALERLVFRSVDELVDDCYPLKHREGVEQLVAAAFGAEREFGLRDIAIDLVHQNFARLNGVYRFEEVGPGGKRTIREIPVVVEGLYDFSPRNWAFRFDLVHMRAETAGRDELADAIVHELLARWRRLPSTGRFRYRSGVFYLSLDPMTAIAAVS